MRADIQDLFTATFSSTSFEIPFVLLLKSNEEGLSLSENLNASVSAE